MAGLIIAITGTILLITAAGTRRRPAPQPARTRKPR